LKKLTIPIILLCLFCLAGIIYGIKSNVQLVKNIDAKNYQLQQRSEMLEMTVIEQAKQIKDLQRTITGLNQANESLNVRYTSDEMYIDELESRYLKIYGYAQTAELILLANGIEFRYTEYPLGYVENDK
jgi:uncharacterized protein YxeA